MRKGKYLLDTNICIFLQKGRKEVVERFREIGLDNCYISEITKAEMLFGAYKADNPSKEVSFTSRFLDQFKILPISDAITIYAQQKARLRKAGTPVDDLDLFIGSTAIAYECIMVTENLRHFNLQEGIKVENWVKR